jgi:ABC-type polysaccharide/polyol phosphate export permease
MLTRRESATAPKLFVITAREDLLRGLTRWELWGRLGWLDVKRRYRRTVIGPFWSSISLTVYVSAVGAVGAGLWHENLHQYLPFLVAGFTTWMLISTLINEGCLLFISAAHLFRQIGFDYSILVYALVWRNFIVFLHHFVVYAVIVLLFAPEVLGFTTLLAIPGLFLVFLNGLWSVLLAGLLCLRFRDVQPLITNIVSVAMFVTPIFWPPDSLDGGKRFVFVDLNPFYHVVDVVRSPLLGNIPSQETYAAVVLITIAGWTLTYLLFRRFRSRISYWS